MCSRRAFWLAALPACVFYTSCNPKGKVEAARKAVEQFHDGYNKRDYAGMFQLAGPAVRKTSSEAAFAQYETGVYAKLGELKSAQIVNYNLLYLLSGPQVRIDYKCQYARGSSVESFEINFTGPRPQIDGYRLDSPQLDNKGG